MAMPQPTATSLRILAALLAYPDAALRAHLGELRALVAEQRALAAARRAELTALIDSLAAADPLDAEARYVEVFDRGRTTSLHLFEHVHGDSRDRGPAMVDLARTYEEAGMVLAEGELPDYLPALLEFASTQPPREARSLLAETAHILNAIHAALAARKSAYASVIAAVLELAGEKVQPVAPRADEPLDESWAEPAAFDACSSKGQARPDAVRPIAIVPRQTLQRGHP